MTCAHFWEVSNLVVKGRCESRCKLCGATKQLLNYIPTTFRNYPEKGSPYVLPKCRRHQARAPGVRAAWYEEH